MTVDGFVLTADPKRGFPSLKANFSVTTYVTPPGEGLFYGASPSAPASVGPVADPIPTSNPDEPS